jgi:prenyltransferase beta subunit
VGGVATVAVAIALAISPAQFLQAHAVHGSFAEPGGAADPSLTAWAVLGLRAAGVDAPGSLDYLQSQESSLQSTADAALVALAERALGVVPQTLLARITLAEHPNGQIGETVNSTIWSVLALGHSPTATTRFVLARQARNGGFAWNAGGSPDSNDTAAALEMFRVAHVTGRPVTRAVSFLLAFQDADGGFELAKGRGSDAQSTAWAIQGLVAAGRTPPRSAFAYLARLKRPDGSFRYSASYATTPVWVTAQVLAALAKKPFPL